MDYCVIENETWKPVVGYEGLYEVSDLGRIKSLAKPFYHVRSDKIVFKKERLNTPNINPYGYYQISLRKKGILKTYMLHRIISLAFVNNPENKAQVNHKDGDKLNNAIENLEWCTQLQNMQHAYQTGLKNNSGENCGVNQQVLEIRSKYIPRKYTIQTLASEYRVDWNTIWRIVTRRAWVHI